MKVWLKRLALGLVALVLLALAAGWLALRSETVQRSLLNRLSAALESAAGLTVEASTVKVRLGAGSVELEDVQVRTLSGEELASADRMRTSIRLWPLLRGRVEVSSLILDSPRLDLSRLPETDKDEPTAEKSAAPSIEIESLRVVEGSIAGLAFGDEDTGRSEVRLSELEIEASLIAGELTVELDRGQVLLERTGASPLSARLEGRLTGPMAGPFDLSGVRLVGAGLDLELAGALGLDESQPLQFTIAGSVDAGPLLDASESGPVTLDGAVDLRAQDGRLTVSAPTIPAELLRPWLGDETFGRLEAAGTTVAVQSDLRFGPGELGRISGTMTGAWRRGEAELIAFSTTPEVVTDSRSLELPFDVRLAPGMAGRRQVSGIASIADWNEATMGEIRDGRLALVLPDLTAARESIRELWPIAARAVPGDLAGAVNVDASFAGPFSRPRVDLEGDWKLRAGGSLRVSGAGTPLDRTGTVSILAERFGIAELGLGWSGQLDGELDLTARADRQSATFDLSVGQLSGADLEPLDILARGGWNGETLTLSTLEAEGMGHRLETVADLALTTDGLRVVAEPMTVDGVTLAVTADVPGSLLANLPIVGARAWTSAFARGRRVRVGWNLPAADLAGLVGLEGNRLEVASSGETLVDLDRLTASEAEMSISTLVWVDPRGSFELSEPLGLTLADGRLTATAARFVTDDSRLDADVTLELTSGWQLDEGPQTLVSTAEVVATGRVGDDWLGELLGSLGEPVNFETELTLDRERLVGTLSVDGADSRLTARGWADRGPEANAPFDVTIEGDLSAAWVAAMAGLEESATGRWRLDLALDRQSGELSGRAELDGTDSTLSLGELALGGPRLDLELSDGQFVLRDVGALVNGEPLLGSGSAQIVTDGGSGQLEIDRLDISFAGIESRWRATVPIKTGDDWPEGLDELAIHWSLAEADLIPVMTLLGALESKDTLRAGSNGSLRIPLATPWLSEGEVEIVGFTWGSAGRQATSDGPIRAVVGDGRATLLPTRIVSSEQLFEIQGHAELAPGWSSDLGLSKLIRELEVRGDGVLLASLLNPFLGGGIGEGELQLDLALSGPPDALRGRLGIVGPDAAFIYARPYLTRFSEPDLELLFEPGEALQLSGNLQLNEGSVELSTGTTDAGRMRFAAELDGVRYRLDYGMLALLDGELALVSEAEGTWKITGVVEVENGVLTRAVDLDLDFLLGLLAPVDLTSTEESQLEAFALDLELRTVEGVRIKNNVADLWLRWDPVRIGGTLAAPVLDGRFDVEPGGRVYAFGQTVRVDSASLDYPGVADMPATLDMKITSSIEDPTIAGLAADDPFASDRDRPDDEVDKVQAVASGLGSFYGEQLASRLTSGAAGARVSLQPLLIFGEADPGTRLTVSQDFSPHVTVAASADLRSAEDRTYLLDVHALDAVPGLNVQLFTTDTESQGVALRQRRRLGPGRAQTETGPRVRAIDYQLPDGISKRRVKRALGVKKGDRLGDGARFAAEVEVTEVLRARGYPDARATVVTRPVTDGVELSVSVRPGPRALFEFEGTRLPKALKRRVVDLYRADYWEEQALVEMAAEGRRALRSLGYLEPQVEVTAAIEEDTPGSRDRRVTIVSIGGERIELDQVSFVPLPEDESVLLAARFSSPVRRVELAAGVAEADRRVEQTLRYIGYSSPRVVERRISPNGKELEVVVETGERSTLRRVEIFSGESVEAEELRPLIALSPGDQVRPDRVASAAARVRDELRSRGYADARVEPRIEPVEGAAGPEADVRFDIDPGTAYFIGQVGFTGLRSTRPKFAAKVADLDLEQDFSEDDVFEARRQLWRTDLFHSVTPEIVRAPGGVVRVDFEVQERQRFEVAYGLRWDSDDELSTLVEAIDRNVLGRGWTAGLRAQWASDDQSLRAFAGLPRALGARTSVGLFTSIRERTEGGLITETIEGTLQLSLQLAEKLTTRLYGQLTESLVSEVIPDPFFPFEVRLTRPVIGSQVLYDTRYGEALSRLGLLVTGDLSVSHQAFGSDFDYARFFGQINYQRRLPGASRNWIWAQSLRIGLAEAFEQEVVRLDRFFAGGEFSVRGYLTESLGPQENLISTVRARGGDALLVINEELRWRFADRYSVVGFVDAGNVWVKLSDFGSDLATSVGLGFRALTPVGLLRLDLARPLDRRDFDPGYKLYFGFGSTF